MDSILTAEIIKALTDGDIPRLIAYILIFIFIWIEVRGLKKEVTKLTATIAKGFAEGEARFDRLETNQTKFDYRLSAVENKS